MIKAKHRATSVKGGIGSYESHTDTHLSLHTLSAGDLKIYSSTYPILRYSYHVSCEVMRQGIAPAACSSSSFYINHSEATHPLSATLFSWSVTKWVVSLFFLSFFFNQKLWQHIWTDWCQGHISHCCIWFQKYRSLCAVWTSADMIFNVTLHY